jgi:hypothetical protein
MKFYKEIFRYYKYYPLGITFGIGKTGIDCEDFSIWVDFDLLFLNLELGIVFYSKNCKKINYNMFI